MGGWCFGGVCLVCLSVYLAGVPLTFDPLECSEPSVFFSCEPFSSFSLSRFLPKERKMGKARQKGGFLLGSVGAGSGDAWHLGPARVSCLVGGVP